MKCFFCNTRCRLLKKREPDYKDYEMTWLCENHPTTRVRHHVRLTKYSLRRDRSIQGISRVWENSSVQWVNQKGQTMKAFWYRSYGSTDPSEFVVYTIKRGKDRWQDRSNEVFRMDSYPEGFTPENIARKVESLIIFS